MRRPAVVVAVLAALLLLTACRPDPTTGDPPPPGATWVPPFRAAVTRVTPADLGPSWRPGCPVHHTNLRDVEIPYWNYSGNRRVGHLIVNVHVIEDIRAAFRRLYDQRFPVRSIRPVSEFRNASDARSMAANNTSAFNCRSVAGTTTWSQHSYGRAVDINPIQNPYVVNGRADPTAGQPWVSRSGGGPGMAMPGNVLVRAFTARGWGWGGTWTSKKDYQHFSQSGR
jgi:hypothetical protein